MGGSKKAFGKASGKLEVTQKIASLEIERISEDCYRLKKVEINPRKKIRGRDENP